MEEVPGYNGHNELNTNSRVNFRPRSQQDIAIDVAQDNSFFEALATKLGVTVLSLRKLSHDYVTHLDNQANSLVTRALISDEVFGHFLELETAEFIKHATLMRGVKNPETNAPTYFTKNAPEEADEDVSTFSPLQLLEKLLSLSEDSPARRELGADIYNLFVQHPLCRTTRFKALCNAYEHEEHVEEKRKIQEQMRAYCSSKDALEHYLLGKSREDRENPNKPNRLSAFYYSKAYDDFFKKNYQHMWNLTKQQILELLRSNENEDVKSLRENLEEEIKHILSTNPNLAEGRNPQEIEAYSKSENALIWLLRDTTYREQLHFTRACETYKQHTNSRATKDKIISGLLLDENDERKQKVLREDSASEEPSLSAGTFRQFKAKHTDTTIRVWESKNNNKELVLVDPVEKRLGNNFGKKQKNELSNKNRGYIRHEVLGNGDCGYSAFGITRKEAYKFLNESLQLVRDILKPAVSELLITEKFYNYLTSEKRIEANVTHQSIENNLEQYATDLNILAAFIDFDVRDGKIDAGWAHPVTLQALARIRGISLYIWQLGQNEELIPHNEVAYARYIHPENGERTDLLFINGNHFERLEFIGFNNQVPLDADFPIYPLESYKSHLSTGYQEIDVLKTEDAPARYLILTSVAFEPLGSYNDFCLQHTAAATSKINWIKTTLGEARYQTYLETIGTTHAGLPEIDGIIICDKLSQPEAPLSLSVTKVDKHGKAKKNRSPMLISPNSHYSRKDTIHLLVRKDEYSLGETADETFLRLVDPDLRTPAAPRIEGHIELRGEPIGDPFTYLNKLDKKIARGDENARAARTNLFALMIDLDSPVYTIYRTDNNRFFAKIERGNGFNENDIHDRDKACYRRIKYTIHALFILQLFLAMAPQGAQALVEAREDFNLFWSTMIACDAIFGKMFFLYRISRGNYDNMALALYDLKINGKERFKQFANTMTHGTWGAQHIQRGIGYVAMTFPPGLLFAGLAPMAFDGYTGLVIKDGLTSGYLWLSDNIAQSEAVRIACSLSSFSTNFFSVPIVLYYGQNTIYGIFWDGKIAFLKENDKAFHRSRYIASTTAGLGLTGYLADGFFNFYGLSQAIFGPYLGCAINNTAGAMIANATNATAAFPQYAAPAANVIAGYNLGYMELILLMSAYGFGSNAIKLIFDLFSGDAKLSNLPNHDKDVPPENRFRLIPQILIHGLSTVISSSIVLFGSYPNLWQARKTGLTSLNNRITAAGSSAITEVDGTFHGILAFVEWFVRKLNCCCPGKKKDDTSPVEVIEDDNVQDDMATKSSYKNRCCPSFWNKISKWRNRNTDTEETALLERNSSASERSRSSSLDIN